MYVFIINTKILSNFVMSKHNLQTQLANTTGNCKHNTPQQNSMPKKTWRKNLGPKTRNSNKLNPHTAARSRNQTWATLLGGEHLTLCHHSSPFMQLRTKLCLHQKTVVHTSIHYMTGPKAFQLPGISASILSMSSGMKMCLWLPSNNLSASLKSGKASPCWQRKKKKITKG